jgi:ABC-type antimicrobial peptide transport system permease subunit
LITLILKQALVLTLGGLAVGLILAWFATKVLESMLYETQRADPITLVAIGLLMISLTIIAAWAPARRAARADPMQVLRSD